MNRFLPIYLTIPSNENSRSVRFLKMDILDAQSMRPGGVEHQVSDPAIIPLTETKSRDERIILETHRTDRPRRTGTLLQAEPQRAC
jgi:hypothetical protein